MTSELNKYEGLFEVFRCEYMLPRTLASSPKTCSDIFTEASDEIFWCPNCKKLAELKRILARYETLKANVIDYLSYKTDDTELLIGMHKELEYRAKLDK